MTIKRHNPIALLPIQKIIFFALICFMPLSAANFTVEMYGGTGNGTTDDSQAFISCIAAMKSNGQDNVLTLGSQKIYRLGKQTVIGTSKVPRITGEALFKGFTKNIKIVGNYSTLRLNAGLKWGSFDPATGAGYYPPNFPQVQFVDQAYKCNTNLHSR